MNPTRDEMLDKSRGLILAFYGGPEKLDCWLNRIAEMMASPETLDEQPIDQNLIPLEYQGMRFKPREVVDRTLATLEKLALWKFRLDGQNGMVEVFDFSSGHIVETLADTPANLEALAIKYGVGDGTP